MLMTRRSWLSRFLALPILAPLASRLGGPWQRSERHLVIKGETLTQTELCARLDPYRGKGYHLTIRDCEFQGVDFGVPFLGCMESKDWESARIVGNVLNFDSGRSTPRYRLATQFNADDYSWESYAS